MVTQILAWFKKTDLITSFVQDSADKHIPSKTSRSVSSVQWITPEIGRKLHRKNATHAKAKKTGSVVQKLDLNLKLYGEKSNLILGSSMTFM